MNELLLLSGLAGLLAGIILSRCAHQEVEQGKKYFFWARDGAFMIASALFLYAFGIILLVVVLLVLSIIIRVASPRVKQVLIALTLPLMLFFNLSNQNIISPLAALYALIGVLEGGILSAKREAGTKKTRQPFLISSAIFVIPPLILLVNALVTT